MVITSICQFSLGVKRGGYLFPRSQMVAKYKAPRRHVSVRDAVVTEFFKTGKVYDEALLPAFRLSRPSDGEPLLLQAALGLTIGTLYN